MNVCMGIRHSIPDGYKIIKNMNDESYYFIFHEKEYGPYSTRFVARNKSIEHDKKFRLKDLDQLSETTQKFINNNK